MSFSVGFLPHYSEFFAFRYLVKVLGVSKPKRMKKGFFSHTKNLMYLLFSHAMQSMFSRKWEERSCDFDLELQLFFGS